MTGADVPAAAREAITVPPQAITDLGRLAYETWQRERGVRGQTWNLLTDAVQAHWKTTARAVAEAAAPHMAAAERGGMTEVLTGHYLANITCDHERKRDRPECACSLVDLGWHPSVGDAVQAWIRHVMWQRSADLLREQP